MIRSRTRPFVMLALAVGAGWAVSPVTADDKPLLRLRAFAVDLNGARTGTLDIVIERWSTDAERDLLLSTLAERGEDALLSTLRKIEPRAGYIRTPTTVGWDLHFARQQPFGDGARRIILATDRPMSFWELRNQPRSVDYAFTLAEIRLGKDGKGEGKLVPAAKVEFDKDTRTVEIENYEMQPVRLTEVRVEEEKK